MGFVWAEMVPGLWRGQYQTSTGIAANTYAFRLSGQAIAVLSPPAGVGDEAFAATDALGPVGALIANNTGHDLGQEAWQARYPNADCHAPAVAGPKLAKARPKLRPFRPLADLAARLPPTVALTDVPGTSSGLTMLAVDGGDRGRALFVDELVFNLAELPRPVVVRFVFWMTGSGPGLVRNKIWGWVFAKDRALVVSTVMAELDRCKPTMVLTSHGEPVTTDPVAALKGLFA